MTKAVFGMQRLVAADLNEVLRISKKQERGARVAEIGERALSVLTAKGRAEQVSSSC